MRQPGVRDQTRAAPCAPRHPQHRFAIGQSKHSADALVGNGVTAVRGRGLWAGVDIDPAARTGREVSMALRDSGVLCKETHERTLRIAPPLVITRDEIDQAMDALISAIHG